MCFIQIGDKENDLFKSWLFKTSTSFNASLICTKLHICILFWIAYFDVLVQFNAEQLYSLAQEVTLLLLEMTQEDSPAKSDSSNKNSTSHWWDQGEVHSLRHEEYNLGKEMKKHLRSRCTNVWTNGYSTCIVDQYTNPV